MNFLKSFFRYFSLGLIASNIPFIYVGMLEGFTVIFFSAFAMALFKYHNHLTSNKKVVVCGVLAAMMGLILDALVYGGLNWDSFSTIISVHLRFGFMALISWVVFLLLSFNYKIQITKKIVRE